MPSDFSARAQRAYASLVVPDVPLAAIRGRAVRADRRRYAALAAACCAMLAVAIGAGTSAGAAISSQFRFWLSGGRAAVDIQGLTVTSYPTRADLAALAQRATFRVVLPLGAPAGTQLVRVMSAPSDRPTTITLNYARPHGGFIGLTLVDPRAAESGAPPATAFSAPVTTWTLPTETVLASARQGDNPVIRTMVTAMRDATPQSSLADSAATTVDGIALNPHQLAQIPRLANAGAPLLDNRTVILTNIPRVHDAPDYQHATLTWSRHVALAPDAVRDVARYLRTHAPPHTPLLYVPGAPNGARVRPLLAP